MKGSKLTYAQIFEGGFVDGVYYEPIVANLNTVIWFAAPIMFTLVFLEWYLTSKDKIRGSYNTKDFFASSAIGIGNLILNKFIQVFIIFVPFYWVYTLSPFQLDPQGPTWWSFLLCLITLDFARYWAHRIAHEQRFWWSTHVVHHSSEHYNFAVSFRLSWTQNLKLVFFLPVILLGFHPLTFFIAHQVEVLYQFWIHNEFIRKLPRPIEYIFTTPSHHRVHHAVNDKYIDTNYGSTFIIWDRIFGTFQPEEEDPTYGITKPVNSYNPVILVFHAWGDMFKDIWKHPKDALRIMFGSPTEWERKQMERMAKAKAQK